MKNSELRDRDDRDRANGEKKSITPKTHSTHNIQTYEWRAQNVFISLTWIFMAFGRAIIPSRQTSTKWHTKWNENKLTVWYRRTQSIYYPCRVRRALRIQPPLNSNSWQLFRRVFFSLSLCLCCLLCGTSNNRNTAIHAVVNISSDI